MMLALAASTSTASALPLAARGSLSPNTPKKVSKLTLSVVNVPTQTMLPTGMTLTLQKGFTPSIGGAASLCTAALEASNGCPTSSLIGTGTETVTPTQGIFGLGGALPLSLKVYLGVPSRPDASRRSRWSSAS